MLAIKHRAAEARIESLLSQLSAQRALVDDRKSSPPREPRGAVDEGEGEGEGEAAAVAAAEAALTIQQLEEANAATISDRDRIWETAGDPHGCPPTWLPAHLAAHLAARPLGCPLKNNN
jgi:hypothetical protein